MTLTVSVAEMPRPNAMEASQCGAAPRRASFNRCPEKRGRLNYVLMRSRSLRFAVSEDQQFDAAVKACYKMRLGK